MIKYFCDCCGEEIAARDIKDRNPLNRLTAKLKRLDCTLTVEVLETKDGCSNSGNFCRYCVLAALQELNDRPQGSQGRLDCYSELAKALGSDPMDSHAVRLDRAKRARALLEA